MVVRGCLGVVFLAVFVVGCSDDVGFPVARPTVVPDDSVDVGRLDDLVGLLAAGGLECRGLDVVDPIFGLNPEGIDHQLPTAARCLRSAPETDVLLYMYETRQSRQDAINTGELQRNACALFGGFDLGLDALVGANWRVVAQFPTSGRAGLATALAVVAQPEPIDCRSVE